MAETLSPTPPSDPETKAPATPAWGASASDPAPASGSAIASRADTRRGGIGFGGALVLSILAAIAGAAGGAGLSLFALGRPQLLQSVGLGALLPQSPQAGSGETAAAELAALDRAVDGLGERLSRIESATGAAAPASQPSSGAAAPAPAPAPSDPPAEPSGAAGAPSAPVAEPLPAPPAALVDLSNLRGELQGIGGRITAIETRLAALDPTGTGGAIIAGLQAEIANLKAAVATLQQQAQNAPSAAATFAMVSLAEAARRPGPFTPEFEAMRAAIPGTPEVAALEALSRQGAPTLAMLQDRFAGLAPDIAAQEAQARQDGGIGGWFQRLWSDLVRVRPAAGQNAAGSEPTLNRAKAALDQGELATAAQELASIANPPESVRLWVSDARRRLEIEARVAAVRGAVERGAGRAAPAPAAGAALPPASGSSGEAAGLAAGGAPASIQPPAGAAQAAPSPASGPNP